MVRTSHSTARSASPIGRHAVPGGFTPDPDPRLGSRRRSHPCLVGRKARSHQSGQRLLSETALGGTAVIHAAGIESPERPTTAACLGPKRLTAVTRCTASTTPRAHSSLDGACTNNAESFFSRMRRGEIGHHHHIVGPYLARFAQEAAWREDHRREPNGSQVDRVVALAMANKPSVDFCVLAAEPGCVNTTADC
jgi:hypothetical protein